MENEDIETGRESEVKRDAKQCRTGKERRWFKTMKRHRGANEKTQETRDNKRNDRVQ